MSTGTYCHNVGDTKGQTIHKAFETARNNSDRGIWTGDFIPQVKYKDLSNGVFVTRSEVAGKVDTFSELGFPIKSKMWREMFNEPEVPNFGIEWHNDITLERHIYELVDPPVQKFTVNYAQYAKEWLSHAIPNFSYLVNDNAISKVTAEALVVHPFDYREGFLTHGTGQSTDVDWKKTEGFIPVESAFTAVSDVTNVAKHTVLYSEMFKPIPGLSQNDTNQVEWLPTNVPNGKRTFAQAGMGKYPSLRNYKDFAYLFDQDNDTSAKAFEDMATGRIAANQSLRMWPALQPFSGQKTMHPLYYYFDSISQGAGQRTVWLEYKVKVSYKIATYEMENPLDSMETKRLGASKKMRTLNELNYGAPMFEKVKVMDFITRKFADKNCSTQRMFIGKPLVHTYKIEEPKPK